MMMMMMMMFCLYCSSSSSSSSSLAPHWSTAVSTIPSSSVLNSFPHRCETNVHWVNVLFKLLSLSNCDDVWCWPNTPWCAGQTVPRRWLFHAVYSGRSTSRAKTWSGEWTSSELNCSLTVMPTISAASSTTLQRVRLSVVLSSASPN